MSIFKEWVKKLGLNESEIIVDEKTYRALQEKYDKSASDLSDTRRQLKLVESERDYLNKRITELMKKYEKLTKKYDEVKDYVLWKL